MDNGKLLNIQIVPSEKDPWFEQRESGIVHTSYMEEVAFYSLVQQGNVEAVREVVDKYITSGLFVGKMSDDPLMQTRYWAVCSITLGIRYAIQGGLDELWAYNLSDEYIRKVDSFSTSEDILEFAREIVVELTQFVHKNSRKGCPKPIRKSLDYIDKHLHEKLSVAHLAQRVDLSADYFSRLFKKHVGQSVGDYIMAKKLETAKSMLRNDVDPKLVAYYLGFCSQTYFITCFKKAYGVTPHKYCNTDK